MKLKSINLQPDEISEKVISEKKTGLKGNRFSGRSLYVPLLNWQLFLLRNKVTKSRPKGANEALHEFLKLNCLLFAHFVINLGNDHKIFKAFEVRIFSDLIINSLAIAKPGSEI
jgi:hypothetical protein